MTYNKLLALTNALLVGDNIFTEDPEERLVLLEYALDILSNEVTALKLLTATADNMIIRQGPGDTFIRKPAMPVSGDSELDIDNELCFPLARYMASFISVNNTVKHERAAEKMISIYNSKVERFLDTESLIFAREEVVDV